jgi:hypothetical protein
MACVLGQLANPTELVPSFLRSFVAQLLKLPAFYEYEGAFLCSQEPYPEPDESIPQPHILFLKDPS